MLDYSRRAVAQNKSLILYVASTSRVGQKTHVLAASTRRPSTLQELEQARHESG